MIPGYDKAVANMKVGEKLHIHLMPEEAYGPVNPNAFATLGINQLPDTDQLSVGQKIYLVNNEGQQIPATVVEKTEETITFDLNDDMAGKELNFDIELVEVL